MTRSEKPLEKIRIHMPPITPLSFFFPGVFCEHGEANARHPLFKKKSHPCFPKPRATNGFVRRRRCRRTLSSSPVRVGSRTTSLRWTRTRSEEIGRGAGAGRARRREASSRTRARKTRGEGRRHRAAPATALRVSWGGLGWLLSLPGYAYPCLSSLGSLSSALGLDARVSCSHFGCACCHQWRLTVVRSSPPSSGQQRLLQRNGDGRVRRGPHRIISRMYPTYRFSITYLFLRLSRSVLSPFARSVQLRVRSFWFCSRPLLASLRQ